MVLAGDESRVGNPLFSDFLLVRRKLEELGFTYYNGSVTIIDLSEVKECYTFGRPTVVIVRLDLIPMVATVDH